MGAAENTEWELLSNSLIEPMMEHLEKGHRQPWEHS